MTGVCLCVPAHGLGKVGETMKICCLWSGQLRHANRRFWYALVEIQKSDPEKISLNQLFSSATYSRCNLRDSFAASFVVLSSVFCHLIIVVIDNNFGSASIFVPRRLHSLWLNCMFASVMNLLANEKQLSLVPDKLNNFEVEILHLLRFCLLLLLKFIFLMKF